MRNNFLKNCSDNNTCAYKKQKYIKYARIRENAGQWKPVFSHILCSVNKLFFRFSEKQKKNYYANKHENDFEYANNFCEPYVCIWIYFPVKNMLKLPWKTKAKRKWYTIT